MFLEDWGIKKDGRLETELTDYEFNVIGVMITNNGNTTYYFENKKSRVYTDTDGTVAFWN